MSLVWQGFCAVYITKSSHKSPHGREAIQVFTCDDVTDDIQLQVYFRTFSLRRDMKRHYKYCLLTADEFKVLHSVLEQFYFGYLKQNNTTFSDFKMCSCDSSAFIDVKYSGLLFACFGWVAWILTWCTLVLLLYRMLHVRVLCKWDLCTFVRW